MKLVNWQPLFTDHQLFTWQALQTLVTDPITHVIGSKTSETRKQQGWKGANLSDLDDIRFFEGNNWWQYGTSIIRNNPNAVHIFCGYWAERRYFLLIMYALWYKSNVVIVNESFSNVSVGYLVEGKQLMNAIKAVSRPLLYRIATSLLMFAARGKKPALLAISLRAVEQFKQSGLHAEQVFPFGYFVPSITSPSTPQKSSGKAIRLIFVGSLLPTKGLDVAIAAVTSCQTMGLPISLDVYGVGNPTKYINNSTLGTTYCGTIPFGRAQEVIAQYDALILPSRHDGWGVVVNEALLQGVPVIASENVGSRCLVETSGAGAVFRNENVNELTQLLQKIATNPTLLTTWKTSASKVPPLIQPSVAAQYMLDMLNYYFYDQGNRPKLLCCATE